MKNTNTTINNTSNIINNKINNEIKIVAFGKEDIDDITDKTYKTIMNRGYQSVPHLIKHIHFNKDNPENHNIILSKNLH